MQMSLEKTQRSIENLYANLERELLLNIAHKLASGKPMEIDKWDLKTNGPIIGSGGVNEWQLERLKELGGLNRENAKIIAKYSKKTVKEVEKVFQRAREIGTTVDEELLKKGIKAGILNEIDPFVEDVHVRSILSHAIHEVLTTFNEQNVSLLVSAGNNYKSIINSVTSQVMAGTKTMAQAMQESVSKLAQDGLTGFTAKNGARWTPEAYTKMVIKSNIQNAINNIMNERMKLAGNDYIEISQHVGARPKCSQDQGQIYSLSGNTAPIEDLNGRKISVRPWSTSSYGQPDGILGINCHHYRYTFVPGISIFRSEKIDKVENDRVYAESQQQRAYERGIRKKKTEIEMLKRTGCEDDFISQRNRQLREYRSQYRTFLNDTGRTRVPSNEWVGTK